MIKTITKYVDTISGEEFTTERSAKASENRSRGIMELFSFYKAPKAPKNASCSFENGEFCIQREKKYYDRFADVLHKAIQKYDKWIASGYQKDPKFGTFPVNSITSGFIGRSLSENDSGLYKWWHILNCICPTCYREYGQPYYRINCKHDDSIKTKTMRK